MAAAAAAGAISSYPSRAALGFGDAGKSGAVGEMLGVGGTDIPDPEAGAVLDTSMGSS